MCKGVDELPNIISRYGVLMKYLISAVNIWGIDEIPDIIRYVWGIDELPNISSRSELGLD